MMTSADNPAGSPISVLVVDVNTAMRRALEEVVSGEPGLKVVGSASNPSEALATARETCPDVAVVDVRMDGGGGPVTTRDLRALDAPPRVIAISISHDREAIIEMLGAGAIGYLVKGGPIEELRSAIRRAARDEPSLSPGAASGLIGSVLERRERQEVNRTHSGELKAKINRVIVGEGLEAVFQPIFALEGGDLIGYEALARFTEEPRRGPLEWFADAAAVDLNVELELAAIRTAVARSRPTAGSHDPLDGAFLALNASPETVLCDDLGSVLETAGAPDEVVLEVTEHARVEDYPGFVDALRPLRDGGVKLAIDDVGAGYASLRHILQLEPDLLKLDNALTHGIEHDPPRRAMAAALVAFARETGATLVAEGIESEREVEALLELGADCGQGYYLARPGELSTLPKCALPSLAGGHG